MRVTPPLRVRLCLPYCYLDHLPHQLTVKIPLSTGTGEMLATAIARLPRSAVAAAAARRIQIGVTFEDDTATVLRAEPGETLVRLFLLGSLPDGAVAGGAGQQRHVGHVEWRGMWWRRLVLHL